MKTTFNFYKPVNIVFAIAISSLLLSCSANKSDQKVLELSGEFKEFASSFPTLSLPLSLSKEKELKPGENPLPAAGALRYLEVAEQTEAFPVGSIITSSYVSLIYYLEESEDNYMVAVFFDAQGNKKGEVVILYSTNEVAERFAQVEQTTWSIDSIVRKIEYHEGNSDADPSHYVQVITKIGEGVSLQTTPDPIVPEGGISLTHSVKLVEYRSPQLNGYELYAAFPQEDAPVYLIRNKNTSRVLSENDQETISNGISLVDDEFIALQPSGETEKDGIITFDKITLTKKDKSTAEFSVAMVKRALTIGKQYTYTHEGNATGELTFESASEQLKFTASTNSGEPDFHICELSGSMRYKANSYALR